MPRDLTASTVELLQTLIRNKCVNDGSVDSGFESRNADVLQSVVELPGVEIERWEPVPGRASFAARLPGTDRDAPSLGLMGHTDVVPVNVDGWREDPFAGEIIDGEVWGRGAVDMLNLTSSMAVAFAAVAESSFRPKGDLVFFAVADEEAGSQYGARYAVDHHADAVRTTYMVTENGGIHFGGDGNRSVAMNVGEKGVSWRRLKVHGTPGHGSMPFGSDNALVRAAAVVNRLAEYRPPARFHEYWRGQVAALDLPPEVSDVLLDETAVDEYLDALPSDSPRGFLHACTHTTFSPNVIDTTEGPKTNIIPGAVDIEVDIRMLPGDGHDEVNEHLRAALGDELFSAIDVEVISETMASGSPTNTPLWDSLHKAVNVPFPDARLNPQFLVGFTDARIMRELGTITYGAGLMSPTLDMGDFGRRFHGHNERIDIESLRLTVELWDRVIRDLLA